MLKVYDLIFLFYCLRVTEIFLSLRRDSQVIRLNSFGTVKDNKMRTFEVGPNTICIRWPGAYGEKGRLMMVILLTCQALESRPYGHICECVSNLGERPMVNTTCYCMGGASVWMKEEASDPMALLLTVDVMWAAAQAPATSSSAMTDPGSPDKLAFLKLPLPGTLLQWQVTNTEVMLLVCFYINILIIIFKNHAVSISILVWTLSVSGTWGPGLKPRIPLCFLSTSSGWKTSYASSSFPIAVWLVWLTRLSKSLFQISLG